MKDLTLSLVVVSFSVLAGCAASEPHPSEDAEQNAGATEETPSKDKAKEGTTSSTTATTKDSSPTEPACPDVKGAWGGPIEGFAKAISSTMDEKVDGTSTIELVAEGSDENELSFGADSIFDVVVQTKLGKVPLKQAVSGKVTCGTFAAHLSTTSGSSKLAGDASCTMTADGCTGSWSVDENGEPVAKGTFTLTRR